MYAFPITAEHWQAALEVPKDIALDVTAPTNLRLQASRMVQAMLKMILKDAKDRPEPCEPAEAIERQPQETPKPAQPEDNLSDARSSSSYGCEVSTHASPEPVPPTHADTDNGMAPIGLLVKEKPTATESPPGGSVPPDPVETSSC